MKWFNIILKVQGQTHQDSFMVNAQNSIPRLEYRTLVYSRLPDGATR